MLGVQVEGKGYSRFNEVAKFFYYESFKPCDKMPIIY